MREKMEVLQGGVHDAGAVVRVGVHVLRPTNPRSSTIHALLAHGEGRYDRRQRWFPARRSRFVNTLTQEPRRC